MSKMVTISMTEEHAACLKDILEAHLETLGGLIDDAIANDMQEEADNLMIDKEQTKEIYDSLS